jgi:hypothetical protein
MASHDFSNSLSGRVGVFDTAFAMMRGASKQANSAQQSQTTNHIVLMYLFLTQYATPRSIRVATFHRVDAGSWACNAAIIRFLWCLLQPP